MGWSNQAVIAFLVEVLSGKPGTGLFVYSGNPGPGNPPVFAVVAPGITTDPYGNLVDAVVTVGSAAGAHIQMDAAGDLVAHAASGAEIWLIPSLPATLIYDSLGTLVESSAPAGGADSAGNQFLAGSVTYTQQGARFLAVQNYAGQVAYWTTPNSPYGPWTLQTAAKFNWTTAALQIGPAGAPVQEIGDGSTNLLIKSSIDQVQAVGTRIGAENPASLGSEDPWHSLGSPSATGFSSDHGRYRMTAENEVEFDIQLTANVGGGTSGAYAYANTLPAAYRPALTRVFPLGYNQNVVGADRFPRLVIGTGGAVTVGVPALNAGTSVGGNIRMPLD